MRRGALARLVLLFLLVAVLASLAAVYIPWLPVSASRQAAGVDFVFWLVSGISIFIFAIVVAVLVYAAMHFRAAPDDDSDGPPIHGHTGLEVAWTVIPALLVMTIAIASAIVLARNDRVGRNPLHVEVIAQQFAWTFRYTDFGGFRSGVLRLPRGRPVEFTIHSLDVIHSFWVPQFRQKQDAVPGLSTHVAVTPTRLGRYPVICAELCGLGHALMRSASIVMRPAAFAAWLRQQERREARTALPGRAIFLREGCGGCHTLAAAGTSGKVGPDLDKLLPETRRARRPLLSFIRQSIVAPNAYVEPGYSAGVMPRTFGQLPQHQLAALIEFLASAAKR